MIKMLNGRPLLLKKTEKDYRDIKFFGNVRSLKSLPTEVDHRLYLNCIEDQLTLGSCTANAFTSALELIRNMNNLPKMQLSRLFHYQQELLMENNFSKDGGASIRTAVKVGQKIGVCNETIWPYELNKFKIMPSQSAITDALNQRINSYEKVDNFSLLKIALNQGPVIFGIPIYQSFDDSVAGKIVIPKSTEDLLGYHCVAGVGYSNSMNCLIVANSWGSDWGDNGSFYYPYEMAKKSKYLFDAYRPVI
jgi:C1A family cysteine protease